MQYKHVCLKYIFSTVFDTVPIPAAVRSQGASGAVVERRGGGGVRSKPDPRLAVAAYIKSCNKTLWSLILCTTIPTLEAL